MKRTPTVALALLLSAGAAHAAIVGWVGVPLFHENTPQVAVPDVVGEDLATADADLESAGLDTGAVTLTCSAAAANEVLSQTPEAGAMADSGSLVDLVASNGTACLNRGSHIGIRIGIGL